jgi:hypothetical protein
MIGAVGVASRYTGCDVVRNSIKAVFDRMQAVSNAC